MTKKALLTLFAAIIFLQALPAQRDETIFGKTGLRLSGAWGGFSGGYNGFDDGRGGLVGSHFGLEFNKLLTIGWSRHDVDGEVLPDNNPAVGYDLKYGAFTMAFTPQSHKVVHPRLGLMIGTGNLKVSGRPEDAVSVVLPSIGAELNIFKWMRLSLEGGYRFTSGTRAGSMVSDDDLTNGWAKASLRFGWSWGKQYD